MTSRLDRLFALLESCPNASLRTAAAEQLGEIAKSSPSSIDYVFTCLIPLLRHKNWVSRVAASEAIRHIVRHLPDWEPTVNCQSYIDQKDVSTNGFLSLSGLRIDYVLAQGARLYSMDVRELDRNNCRGYFERCKKNNENAMECDTCDPQTVIHSPQILPPVQRQEINSRLGLENDNLLTEVLESHADVSIDKWITTDDFNDETQPGFAQVDVESCVRSAYVAHIDTDEKRFCQSPVQYDTKRIKLDSSSDVTIDKSGLNVQATASVLNQPLGHWPLDRMCTTLLGDLWALRWETRHGAASGLRELLSEPRHTKQAGKYIGQSEIEMYNNHYQYLEDIVVRVLCTLALDQLSDFISDEVVAPVRETAAQLLGVLSLHLTTEQVLLVTKHLIFLVSLNDETVTKLCTNIPCQKDNTNASKNSWMIAHGGLLGIKYLLASRKDLKDTLLPHVTPCLISRLFGIPNIADNQIVSQQSGRPSSFSANPLADDEDIRAAAASALLPMIDTMWVESLSQYEYNLFVNHVWSLIRNTPSDLSPSTGPVLSLVSALTKAEMGKRQSSEQHNSTIKSEEDISIYRINTSEKIMIITELLHHVSSSIRQSSLNTLQCVIESCENQIESLSADTLHIILDNLFLRILLEPCTSIRALVTNLTIKIIQAAEVDCLVEASIRRLDVWLCQVMQPTGIPYPNKFLVPCLRSNSDIQLTTSELSSNNDELTSLGIKVRSTANINSNIPSSNQQAVFIPQPTYCIGGFQCLTASRSEMESYVLETRISAVRVLAYLCSRICQYNKLIPVHLLPCISDNPKSSTSSLPSSANNSDHNHVNNTSISVLNYVIGKLISQLHLKDRLAMQRFISGLLLSCWSLLPPISCLPTGSGDSNDNNSMNSSNRLFNSMNPFNQVNYIDKLTYTWANLLNTSSSTLLTCHLERLQNLSKSVFTNIKVDLHDITKQLRGRLESCLTEVIYYEEILAPFKLMQEDCRELIRLMKSGGLPVDSQIPINGVLTIVHCKTLLQKVAEIIHAQKQHSENEVSCVVDSSLLDRLHCQFERTRTTVDHCLTLQLYLGNRVELGIACAFANMNWILPGRLSLLIRPLMDTIRCVKPCINQSDNSVRSLNSGTDGIFQINSRHNITSTATTTSSIFGGSSSNSSAVGACIDILPIGTCVHLQRLAASCLARLLWLEWKMLSTNLPSQSSSTLLTNKSLLPNTSKAATKVIKNLTSYLVESDSDFLLSLSSTSNPSSEASDQPNEDQSSFDTKIACVNSLSTYRLDLVTTTSSSSETQQQSSQHRGAYISLSCICYTFINLYHHEEGETCWSSSSKSMEPIDHKPCLHRLSNASLNSLRLGIPSLWHLFWINPVKIVINLYRQSGISVENGKFIKEGGEIPERRGNFHLTLKKLTDEVKFNMSKLKSVDLPKSSQDELLSGLIVLSSCLNVILPCIDPDQKESSCDQKDDISFEQIIWLASLVIRLPNIVYRRVGARLLADLTLLRPVYTLNILLPLLLLTSNGIFLPTDSSTICVGTLETFLTIVDKFSNMHNSSSYILQSVPPVILEDPLAEPNSKSSSLLSMCRCFMSPVNEQLTSDFESKLPNELTTKTNNITVISNSEDGSSSLLSNNLKLFLPYVVLLLTPTLRLISNSNQHIRSIAGRLFAALLNLLPLESSIPNPEKMKEEFKQIRLAQREFIDNLLHPDRIQSYNLPIKINGTLRTYQQEGVNWLCFLNRYGLNGVLCDDLGLGKTLQTICILAGSHHELKQCLATHNSNKYYVSNESNVMDTKVDGKPPISLVICPSTLCAHWFHEIQHFAQTEDLNPLIYGGSPSVRQNLQSKLHQYDVIITSYDLVRSDVGFLELVNWNYIVLDEGHIIKSSKSKVTRAVKHLVAQHRLILTGTPIQNRVTELWSLFDFLMPEFLGTEQYFLAKFARPVASSRDPKASKSDQQAGQLALEKLHRLVLPFMLRRLKEDVMQDLPPKIIQDFACKMTPIQRKLYESFQKTDEGQKVMNFVSTSSGDFYSEYRSSSFGGVSTSHGFHALRYFQAVCNHPCLVLKSNHPLLDEVKQELCIDSMEQLRTVHYSGKLLALCRLLTDCGFGSPNSINGSNVGSSGNIYSTTLSSTSGTSTSSHYMDSYPGLLSQHRALIFFQTREMLQLTGEMLKKQFPWITATRLDGTVPVNERHNRVVKFNQDPSIDLMLLTTAVGGLGLNLTGADTVIFVEHDWNPSKDLQAMDRAHRIGQRRTVNVYRLITEDSIEEQIMNLQAFKLHLANTVLTADNKSLNEMDTGHLFDRLTENNDNRMSRDNHTDFQFASLDDLEACYEAEYNLDTFVARLKTN
uniref:Helicase mot1, putative n=1 Tax=Schistosoma mansoni TaxID=6183 RepID=A0A3Q0KR15_SCHMA